MPPDQSKFHKATEDFQSARLFAAAEPLLDMLTSPSSNTGGIVTKNIAVVTLFAQFLDFKSK
jgi:hypothetical protein